jgi:hypothetical protein
LSNLGTKKAIAYFEYDFILTSGTNECGQNFIKFTKVFYNGQKNTYCFLLFGDAILGKNNCRKNLNMPLFLVLWAIAIHQISSL